MALEISEIAIQMRVDDERRPAAGGDDEDDERPPAGADPCGDQDRQRITEDCVRRVLRILDARRER